MIKIVAGPDGARREELVLVRVNAAEGNGQSSETIWARPLGDDLYEIEGPLHLVTGLDPKDVVRAVLRPGDVGPSVSEVVRRSGHLTLHVAFSEGLPAEEQQSLLAALGKWRATWEMAFERFYTVVVDPGGDFRAVCEFLTSSSAEGLLVYEPEVDINALYRYRFSSP